MIGLGNVNIAALTLGNNSVSAVYLGNSKIWPAGITYKIVNPIAKYSSGSSLNPNKSNYATFTATLQKYIGDTLSESSTVDLTPSINDDKVILESNKLYWNKDTYGSQSTTATTVEVVLSYSMNNFSWSDSVAVSLEANTQSLTNVEIPFFYLVEGNRVLTTVNVHLVGGTYDYSISVLKTYSYTSGNTYQTTSTNLDGLQVSYPTWISFYNNTFVIGRLTGSSDRSGKITVTDTTTSVSESVSITQIYETLSNLVITYSSDSMLLPDKSNYFIAECEYNDTTVKLTDIVVNHSTLSDVIVPLNDPVYSYRYYFNKDAYNTVDMSSYGNTITLSITCTLYGLEISGNVVVKANKVESTSLEAYKLNASISPNYFAYSGGTLTVTPASTATKRSTYTTGAQTTEDVDVTTYIYYPTSSDLCGSAVDIPISIKISENSNTYPVLKQVWLKWSESSLAYVTKDFFIKPFASSTTRTMQLWNTETNTKITSGSTISADSEITIIDAHYSGSQSYTMQCSDSLVLTTNGGILTISGIPSSQWTGELTISDGSTSLTFNISST